MKILHSRIIHILFLGFFLIFSSCFVWSDESYAKTSKRDYNHDQDDASRAVTQGEILPITKILQQLERRVPGKVVGVTLERNDTVWIYEFSVMDSKGGLFKTYVDAKSGKEVSR